MRRAWIWSGFGALLLVGVLSGFVPDLKHAVAVRDARKDGLLKIPVVPKIAKVDDARALYVAAQARYPQAVTLLMTDFARQMRKPSPHVVKYMDAIAQASKKSACSSLEAGAGTEAIAMGYAVVETQPILYAARAIVARAQDGSDLETVGRVARHLAVQPSLPDAAFAASLALEALDRADTLGLDPGSKRRIAAAFGPMPVPRERLADWVARAANAQESEKGMSAMRRSTAFLQFWHGFFREFPRGKGAFASEVARRGKELEERRRRAGQWTDYTSVLTSSPSHRGRVSNDLPGWTALLDKADRRVEAAL